MSPTARQSFQRGAAAYNRGDDAGAIAAFTDGLAHDPSSAHAHLFRALSRLRLGLLADAIQDLTHCLDRDPTCEEALWARARVLADQQQCAEAIHDLSRLAALRPDDAKGHSLRGECRRALGDWSGCVTDYRRAAKLAPGDAKTLNRLAWVLATCPVDSLRDGEQSVELAEKANQLAGESDPFIWDTLAVAYAEAGRWADARAASARAGDISAERSAALAAGRPWRDKIGAPDL